ncbi:MAG: hypothetical protein ACXWH7_01260, partial [Thermoanaerobaculia bacterium]
CEVRLYDRLFNEEDPEQDGDFLAHMNPNSLEVIPHAKLEPSVRGAQPLTRYQFERLGYFCVDGDSTAEAIVFNRTATLKDTWAKVAKYCGVRRQRLRFPIRARISKRRRCLRTPRNPFARPGRRSSENQHNSEELCVVSLSSCACASPR